MAIASKDVIANAGAASKVEKLMLELPSEEKITLEDEEKVTQARKAYDELSDVQKTLVTSEKLQILTVAEQKIKTLKEEKANKEAADKVIGQIEALGEVDLTKEEQVAEARKAYDELSEEQKALVGAEKVQVLTDAEKKIEALKEEKANKEAADKVIGQIEALGEVDLTKEKQVEEARSAYEGLTAEQKKKVTNISILEKAEQTIKDLKNTTPSTPEEPAKPTPSKPEESVKPTPTKPATPTVKPTPAKPANKPPVKAGMTVKTASGKEYVKILSIKKKTVVYVKPAKKTYKTIVVPATVKISGVTYKVAAVSSNAFKGMKKLQKVTIGKNVEKISSKVFIKCQKLNKVIITSKKLSSKKVSSKAFTGTKKNITVKVPKNKYKAYKKFLTKKGNKTIKIKK